MIGFYFLCQMLFFVAFGYLKAFLRNPFKIQLHMHLSNIFANWLYYILSSLVSWPTYRVFAIHFSDKKVWALNESSTKTVCWYLANKLKRFLSMENGRTRNLFWMSGSGKENFSFLKSANQKSSLGSFCILISATFLYVSVRKQIANPQIFIINPQIGNLQISLSENISISRL